MVSNGNLYHLDLRTCILYHNGNIQTTLQIYFNSRNITNILQKNPGLKARTKRTCVCECYRFSLFLLKVKWLCKSKEFVSCVQIGFKRFMACPNEYQEYLIARRFSSSQVFFTADTQISPVEDNDRQVAPRGDSD